MGAEMDEINKVMRTQGEMSPGPLYVRGPGQKEEPARACCPRRRSPDHSVRTRSHPPPPSS